MLVFKKDDRLKGKRAYDKDGKTWYLEIDGCLVQYHQAIMYGSKRSYRNVKPRTFYGWLILTESTRDELHVKPCSKPEYLLLESDQNAEISRSKIKIVGG